jgi:hypothetical protein
MNTWDRPRTKLRIAMGICPDCGDNPAASGGKRCEHCRYRQNNRHRATYALRKRLGIPRYTEEQLRQEAEDKQAKRAARKASGLCIQCGSESKKFVRCTACRAKNAITKKRFRERRRAMAEFTKQTNEAQKKELIRKYAEISEGFSTRECSQFWREQEENNTEFWQELRDTGAPFTT